MNEKESGQLSIFINALVLQRKVGIQSSQTSEFGLAVREISLVIAFLVIANAI